MRQSLVKYYGWEIIRVPVSLSAKIDIMIIIPVLR